MASDDYSRLACTHVRRFRRRMWYLFGHPERRVGMEKIKVLIVDDHRVFAEALTLAMAGETDIEIVGEPVLNGADAAKEVVERNPDVVLMDLNLPDQDGIESTRDVKQARPETKV